jgi:hypothetical protein
MSSQETPPTGIGSAIQVMLCPERAAKDRDYSVRYSLTFIRQHYLDTTTEHRGLSRLHNQHLCGSAAGIGTHERSLKKSILK